MNTKESSIPLFFFDTADTEAIRKIWERLSKYTNPRSCYGITTNPNALAKVNCHTLLDLEKLVKSMSDTMDDICGGGSLIYIQVPNSCMNFANIVSWASMISKFDTGKSKIALKIPHFSYVLREIHSSWWHDENNRNLFKNLYLNVTGIADSGTIIKAMNYDDVCFASIIPGRMEETGIDANAHMKYLCDQDFKSHQSVISGSMRTIKGLKDAVHYRTVPTIGTRVWDLIEKENLWEEFPTYWQELYQRANDPSADYCPDTTEKNINLSKQFFEQMDVLGKKLYEDFMLP